MGVDSGLPDFRGTEGFWKAYPALAASGLRFEDIACPDEFTANPRRAWGFYGHRLNLYRRTMPHEGFDILKSLSSRFKHGSFVFTSNVDGHFHRAGFESSKICEAHGSIHRLQCTRPCCDEIWPAEMFLPEVDINRCVLTSDLPLCPHCGTLARPNILMFGDGGWVSKYRDEQHKRLSNWKILPAKPVILEFGAGTAVATVRYLGDTWGPPLIRVNPREPYVKHQHHLRYPMGALAFLEELVKVKRNV